MPKRSQAAATPGVRVLAPSEYPIEITRAQGAYTPDVRFAATHPLGLYHVEDHGAGHLAVYFTARRRGSRAKNVGAASTMRDAMARISRHEDEATDPSAKREEGRNGPVNIMNLGRRLEGAKTRSDLDEVMDAFLLTLK